MPIAHQFRAFTSSSNLLLITKIVTISSMGIFAGTALNYNTVTMPSLRKFASSSSLAVWAEMYHLAKPIQISMIVVSAIGGAGLYYKTHNTYYLAGALMMAAIIPYTTTLLYPINHKLLDIRKTGRDDGTVEEMLIRWDAIHFGRSLLSYSAMIVTLYGALKGHTSARIVALFKDNNNGMSMPTHVSSIFNGENLLLLVKTLTVASMGIGTGAGVAMNVTIMPTLAKFSTTSAAHFFKEMAQPAMLTQVTALVTGLLGGSAVYYKTKNKYFLYGGLIMLSILPYTVVMFLPLNFAIFDFAKSGLSDVDGSIAKTLITWNRRQYGRTALNATAFLTTLYGILTEGSSGSNKGTKHK
ncbi:hypothetical protein BGZ83_006160 [Gryganskiella cystojenkinii]|nr:hypothetical protein BGZ83_006160 [Gryganskiella cystojenkinii]